MEETLEVKAPVKRQVRRKKAVPVDKTWTDVLVPAVESLVTLSHYFIPSAYDILLPTTDETTIGIGAIGNIIQRRYPLRSKSPEDLNDITNLLIVLVTYSMRTASVIKEIRNSGKRTIPPESNSRSGISHENTENNSTTGQDGDPSTQDYERQRSEAIARLLEQDSAGARRLGIVS